MNDPERHPPVDQIRSLTAVRGVAAWWVALYHFHLEMPPLGGGFTERLLGKGYLAVDLFFTLSGFVIALNYTGAFATLAVREYGRFLGRRLARIYPLHFVMLLLFLVNPLAVLLFSHSGEPGARYDPVYYLLSLVLVQNWGFVNDLAWNVPAWSISAEWGAYLLFPLLAWGVSPRLRTPAAALALVAAALTVLAVGAALSVPGLGAAIPRFGLFRCLTEFTAGAGLCWLSWRRPVAGGGSVALAAAALLAAAAAVLPVPDFLLVPAAFALLIHGLSRQPRWVEWVLGWRVLELVGIASYSTYLAHYFVRDWVKFLLVGTGVPAGLALAVYVAATAVASVLLYRLVEVPGRRRLRAAFSGGAGGPTLAAAAARPALVRARG